MKTFYYKKLFFTITLVICLLVSPVSALAEEYKLEPSYSVGGIKVKEPKSESLEIAGAKFGVETKGGTCNNVGNALAAMGINLNEDSLNKVVKNWSGMALPLALYFMATYTPIVKEAVIGAKSMSQMVAQLGNASCESMMKSIDSMNLEDSVLVRECMKDKLNVKDLTSAGSVEKTAAYKYCLDPKNISVLGVFGDNKEGIKKFVSFLDPQSFAKCQMANAGAIVDPENTSFTDLNAMTFANRLGVLATGLLPSFNVDVSSGNFKASTLKIDGKEITILRYAEKMFEDLKNRDIKTVIEDIKGTLGTGNTTTDDMKNKLQQINQELGDKYNIDISGLSLLLELIARWDKQVADIGSTMTKGKDESFCEQDLAAVKEVYLAKAMTKKALAALKAGLLKKFMDIELAATQSAATGSGYGCKIPSKDKESSDDPKKEDKKVTEKTVDLVRSTKKGVIDQLEAAEAEFKDDNSCKIIAEKLKGGCLGPGSIGGEIQAFNAVWKIDDNCGVQKVAISASDQFTPPSDQKKKTQVGDTSKSLFFNMNSFRILAVILMMIAAIYLGKILIQSIPKEEWGIVALNGGAIILILSMMYALVFR